MIPAKLLYDEIAQDVAAGVLLADDTAKMALVTAAFVPSTALLMASISAHLGTDTLAPQAVGDVSTVEINQNTGQWQIRITPPIGGFHWVYNGIAPAPPVSVYGWALINAGATIVVASGLFPGGAIVLNAALQSVDVSDVLLVMALAAFGNAPAT